MLAKLLAFSHTLGREDSFETAYCQTGFFRPKADLSLFRCPFSAVSTSSASIIIAYDPSTRRSFNEP
jgi:hypothetical protein